MALAANHVAPTYANSLMVVKGILADIKASETCLSARVTTHYLACKNHPHLSMKGSTAGQFFEMIFTEALSVLGVPHFRQVLHVKHPPKNIDCDVFVIGAKYPIIIMLKTSLRERFKQEDRDALAIRTNASGCTDVIYEQVGIGKFSDNYPPRVWAVTFREHDHISPESACGHARNIGEKCAGIDTDRCVSVFDKERMDFLVAECKEAQ